ADRGTRAHSHVENLHVDVQRRVRRDLALELAAFTETDGARDDGLALHALLRVLQRLPEALADEVVLPAHRVRQRAAALVGRVELPAMGQNPGVFALPLPAALRDGALDFRGEVDHNNAAGQALALPLRVELFDRVPARLIRAPRDLARRVKA